MLVEKALKQSPYQPYITMYYLQGNLFLHASFIEKSCVSIKPIKSLHFLCLLVFLFSNDGKLKGTDESFEKMCSKLENYSWLY